MVAEGFTRIPDYIVQGHRYNIVQYIGCQPTTYISIPGVFVIWAPPLLLSVASSVYAGAYLQRQYVVPTSDTPPGIALRHFVRMRCTFSSILRVSCSPMSTNQYVRLIGMSVALIHWGTCLTSLTIWADTLHGLRPWVSWEHVHSKWNRADAYVWILMSPRTRRLTFLFWWGIPVSSIIAFLFLGFGEDAVGEYRRVGKAVVSIFPPKALPKWNEKFVQGKPPVPPFPPSGLRFVLFPTPRSNPSNLFQSSFDGSSAPLLTNPSTLNQAFQLPPIQLLSLSSMIGLPRSRTQSRSSGKSWEWSWSIMDEKLRPASLELDGAGGGFCDRIPGMRVITITEPLEVLTRGSVQEVAQGREPHDQV